MYTGDIENVMEQFNNDIDELLILSEKYEIKSIFTHIRIVISKFFNFLKHWLAEQINNLSAQFNPAYRFVKKNKSELLKRDGSNLSFEMFPYNTVKGGYSVGEILNNTSSYREFIFNGMAKYSHTFDGKVLNYLFNNEFSMEVIIGHKTIKDMTSSLVKEFRGDDIKKRFDYLPDNMRDIMIKFIEEFVTSVKKIADTRKRIESEMYKKLHEVSNFTYLASNSSISTEDKKQINELTNRYRVTVNIDTAALRVNVAMHKEIINAFYSVLKALYKQDDKDPYKNKQADHTKKQLA